MKTSFFKVITTRNIFSKEYGTWIMLVFNLLFAPFFLGFYTEEIFFLSLFVLFGMAFRVKLLLISAIYELTVYRMITNTNLLIYFMLSSISFYCFFIQKSDVLNLLILPIGILLLLLNYFTRRRKGQRQHIFAQLVLTSIMALLPAFIYYLLLGRMDDIFWILGLFNMLYYANSIIYVRAKTIGSPFDIYAFILSILTFLVLFIIYKSDIIDGIAFFIFLPMLLKTTDNIVLSNTRVPLRRIGVYETFHSLLYMFIFSYCFA